MPAVVTECVCVCVCERERERERETCLPLLASGHVTECPDLGIWKGLCQAQNLRS